jgi:hypothetical protein
MSQPCTISTCKFKSSALCYCCNKNICIDHLKEHNDSNKSELNSINNEIITLINQFKTFDTDRLIKDGREKLNKWKNDCYYEQKYQELEHFCIQKVGQHRKEIDQIQTTIMDLIRSEKASEKIPDIKREINRIKEKGIQMDIHPFTLDNHCITIKNSKPDAFNINTSILSSPYRTIECVEGWQSELANNDRFILINLADSLCIFDRDLTLIKQSP